MSKKDDKNKKKHTAEGSGKKNRTRSKSASASVQSDATIPPDQQLVIDKKTYEKELARMQKELIKLQEWIRHKSLKVVVIFEGRDAAGKGGVIKRLTESLNPRVCRVSPICRRGVRWCSSTAAGTTGPA
jgi:polyphosphate kinase 2 (PPK2 family)